LASHQQASAWTNFRFGIGLNVEWQSGGNSFLWGAICNGQPPGPQFFGYGAPGYGYPQPMVAAAMPSYYDPPHHDYYQPQPAPGATPPAPHPWTAPAPQPNGGAARYNMPSVHPANYYYPTSYYGQYPSYWYGQ